MRVRFRFTKLGKVRFISHRDVARAWERALRRAELPVALTEGFNPRPKVHFGLALPTGAESLGEYLDVDFRDDLALGVDELAGRISPMLPDGIDIDAAAPIDTSATSLQQAVTSCSWTIQAIGLPADQAPDAVAAVLGAPEILVTRQRKGNDVTDDIRPYILHLAITDQVNEVRSPSGELLIAPAGVELDAELGTQPRGLRPAELAGALGPGVGEGRIRRNQQWITIDGARHEPLLASATSTARAPVGAP
jgi:radical SAM-linked protein